MSSPMRHLLVLLIAALSASACHSFVRCTASETIESGLPQQECAFYEKQDATAGCALWKDNEHRNYANYRDCLFTSYPAWRECRGSGGSFEHCLETRTGIGNAQRTCELSFGGQPTMQECKAAFLRPQTLVNE